MSERIAQVLVSAAVLVLGAAFAAGTWLLPDSPGYAKVSARLFPGLIASGLLITGALLLLEALRGGFRNLEQEVRERLAWRAFGWVSAGIVAHMALVGGIGFILASALLYTATARAFGSARPLRDAIVGILLAALVYVLFTRALTLTLPWGAWLPG
jgi:putative tricarboxylic transport membrane protein